jgi:hypothetical protein
MAESQLQFVELQRSGGQVATYRPSFRVDAATLSAGDRAELETLVRRADVLQQPEAFPAPRIPDAFEYRLTVAYANQRRTIVFHDQDGHPQPLDTLVNWIRAHGSPAAAR